MSRARLEKALANTVVSVLESLSHNGKFCGCEIGVWEAKTSMKILSDFPLVHLHMIDMWKIEGVQMRVGGQGFVDKTKEKAYIRTDFASDRRTIIEKSSLEASFDFDSESLDFVFIDANHKYKHVKDDIHAWWPKVKIGGILLGHDYDGKWERRGKWGVKKAVDEFGRSNNILVNTAYPEVWFIYK
jgi:hypothetical protein